MRGRMGRQQRRTVVGQAREVVSGRAARPHERFIGGLHPATRMVPVSADRGHLPVLTERALL